MRKCFGLKVSIFSGGIQVKEYAFENAYISHDTICSKLDNAMLLSFPLTNTVVEFLWKDESVTFTDGE